MNRTSAPFIQQHELTAKCNNNCAFCYNPERAMGAVKPRPADRERNIAVAEVSVARGVLAVCLTGGEPLLIAEHFFEVLEIYRRAGCYLSMNSNGRLVTREMAERLARSGLNSALISLHGTVTAHDSMVGAGGAYAETLAGICELRRAGVNVTPNFVATAKNIGELRAVGEVLAGLGVHGMTVTPFLPFYGSVGHRDFILSDENFREYFAAVRHIRNLGVRIDSTLPIAPCTLLKLFPKNWREYLEVHSPRVCMAGRSFGVVSPDGIFRSCIQAPNIAGYGGAVLENYTASWRAANDWARADLIPEECRRCAALAVCGGGCRTSCLWENEGTLAGKTMYMGEPLSPEEAEPFLRRVEVEVSRGGRRCYVLDRQVRVRDEGWGVVVWNSGNQSFTVLEPGWKCAEVLGSGQPFFIDSERTEHVLSAIQALKPVDGYTRVLYSPVSSGNKLFPRLAKDLWSMEKVYCLRADTGERYFF